MNLKNYGYFFYLINKLLVVIKYFFTRNKYLIKSKNVISTKCIYLIERYFFLSAGIV